MGLWETRDMAGLMQYVSRILIISLPAVVVFLCFMPYRMRTLKAMNLQSGWQREIGLILFVVSIFGISLPREDNVHLLNRRWVQYEPTRTAHSIGELRQRKNKQGAEAHVFMLAGAGKFSTTID
jgi:hypothetical protein